MSIIVYNKLVRDKIPQICRADGAIPKYHMLKGKKLLNALIDKLFEEVAEVKANPCIEELADVEEVLLAIGHELGLKPEDIDKARLSKSKSRGSFSKGIFLEITEQ